MRSFGPCWYSNGRALKELLRKEDKYSPAPEGPAERSGRRRLTEVTISMLRVNQSAHTSAAWAKDPCGAPKTARPEFTSRRSKAAGEEKAGHVCLQLPLDSVRHTFKLNRPQTCTLYAPMPLYWIDSINFSQSYG